jgi:uncharacterized membrane protein YagU involved in acid resistance
MIYFVTALIVGTLDITYAILFSYYRSGTSPERLLQSVAAGWFGRDAAFAGGTATAAAGLGFHFLIAFTITAIFFVAASRLPALTRNVAITGPLYGIGVYCVMNYVVIPLSKIGPRPFPPMVVFVSGLLVHMFLIGVPIAIGAQRRALNARAVDRKLKW